MTKATASPKAWAVLAGMVLIQAGMMGVIINCTGIVFSTVLEDCGFRAGDLSVYYTIRSLASAAAVGVTSRLFFRYGGKAVMAALGAILALSFGSMYFFDSLWQWYLSGAFAGIGMSCIMVIMPVVLNNWFKAHNGLIIGLAMSSSGIAGAVFSPLCSALVTALGWRMAAVVTACIGGALIIIPSLVLLSISPAAQHRPPPPWNRRPEPLPFPPIFSLQTPQRKQREPSVREGSRCFLFMVLWITLRTRGPAFPGQAEVPAPAYGSCGSPGGRPHGRF